MPSSFTGFESLMPPLVELLNLFFQHCGGTNLDFFEKIGISHVLNFMSSCRVHLDASHLAHRRR